MMSKLIGALLSGLLAASPGAGAELFDFAPIAPARNGAVAGAYVSLALDRPAGTRAQPRAGLRLAMTRDVRDVRRFATRAEANLFDLRLAGPERASLFVAGRPVSGPESDRLNAGGESKGRLDKIMIGAGIALGAVAGFFLVSAVTG
jgi:hypothetical protein